MKITAFYYLDYPDCSPTDPSYAATKMYVEIGQETNTINNFSHTYAFQVYTVKYVKNNFFEKHLPLVERSVLIVAELDDVLMREFLNTNISNLDRWGEAI